MSICGLQGRAYTDPTAPEPCGICDACNFKYLARDLSFQMQWAGNQLINLGTLVCSRCLDVPAEFLRSIVLPPDPIPVQNPRPGFYRQQEGAPQSVDIEDEIPPIPNVLYAESGAPIYTENGEYIFIDNNIPPIINMIFTEDGQYLLTEDNQFILIG